MKLTLRIVTIFCYFLPCTFFFTNCTGGLDLRVAYNQVEADKNALLENESLIAAADTTQKRIPMLNDSTKSEVVSHYIFSDNILSDTLRTSATLGDKVLRRTLMPTDTSLSSIGSIFLFKNLIGKIAISVCILISLILVTLFKVLKSKKIKLYLLLVGTFSLIIFMINSFISNLTLLWGVWTLLAILLIQLIQEFSTPAKAYR